MKKVLKYFFGLIIISILLSVFYLWRNSSTSHDSNKMLLARYPNGFVTKSIKIGDSLIAFSFDNPGWKNWETEDEPNYTSPPIAYLFENGIASDIVESFQI